MVVRKENTQRKQHEMKMWKPRSHRITRPGGDGQADVSSDRKPSVLISCIIVLKVFLSILKWIRSKILSTSPESYYAATTTLQRCHCASVARNQLLYQLNRLRELLNLTIERYYG